MRQPIYIGNLADGVTDTELRSLFAAFGAVRGAAVVRDAVGRSRHFAFVEMEAGPAAAAIAGLHRRVLRGRQIFVQASAARRGRDRPSA